MVSSFHSSQSGNCKDGLFTDNAPLLGIRAYAARNHMRNMNAGDKAFFYHSNCKEPGIAGVMEIVKEFSEDSRSLL